MTFVQRVELKIRLMTPAERVMWAAEIVREGAYPIGQALIRLLTQLGCMLLLFVYIAPPPPEFWPMILRASLIIWISLEAVVALFVRRPLPKLGGALVV